MSTHNLTRSDETPRPQAEGQFGRAFNWVYRVGALAASALETGIKGIEGCYRQATVTPEKIHQRLQALSALLPQYEIEGAEFQKNFTGLLGEYGKILEAMKETTPSSGTLLDACHKIENYLALLPIKKMRIKQLREELAEIHALTNCYVYSCFDHRLDDEDKDFALAALSKIQEELGDASTVAQGLYGAPDRVINPLFNRVIKLKSKLEKILNKLDPENILIEWVGYKLHGPKSSHSTLCLEETLRYFVPQLPDSIMDQIVGTIKYVAQPAVMTEVTGKVMADFNRLLQAMCKMRESGCKTDRGAFLFKELCGEQKGPYKDFFTQEIIRTMVTLGAFQNEIQEEKGLIGGMVDAVLNKVKDTRNEVVSSALYSVSSEFSREKIDKVVSEILKCVPNTSNLSVPLVEGQTHIGWLRESAPEVIEFAVWFFLSRTLTHVAASSKNRIASPPLNPTLLANSWEDTLYSINELIFSSNGLKWAFKWGVKPFHDALNPVPIVQSIAQKVSIWSNQPSPLKANEAQIASLEVKGDLIALAKAYQERAELLKANQNEESWTLMALNLLGPGSRLSAELWYERKALNCFKEAFKRNPALKPFVIDAYIRVGRIETSPLKLKELIEDFGKNFWDTRLPIEIRERQVTLDLIIEPLPSRDLEYDVLFLKAAKIKNTQVIEAYRKVASQEISLKRLESLTEDFMTFFKGKKVDLPKEFYISRERLMKAYNSEGILSKEEYIDAFESGDRIAAVRLAIISKGFKYILAAYERVPNGENLYQLASFLEENPGKGDTLPSPEHLYLNAAHQGHVKSQLLYAKRVIDNQSGDPKLAVQFLRSAARTAEGERESLVLLGICYARGIGVAKKPKLSKYYYDEAVNKCGFPKEMLPQN